MKIVVAPDSFKGTLTAVEAARRIRRGLAGAFPDAVIVELPLSDGGEGFVDAVVAAAGGEIVEAAVRDPLGRPIVARFGLLDNGETAVVEMAAASGLGLLDREERDPLSTTTLGTGDLIAAALDRGVSRILLGIGGSATVDGGVGMASALGARFLDAAGQPIGAAGGNLGALETIDASGLDARLVDVAIEVACDVDNPLTGPRGAAAVYGPQKGATAQVVAILDKHLRRLAATIRRDLGAEVEELPGGGAAGGLGAGLMAFLGAELRPGAALVLDGVGFGEVVRGADLVVTGEGRLDTQSLHGKVPVAVARQAAAAGCPTIALAGSLGGGLEPLREAGIECWFGVVGGAEAGGETLADPGDALEWLADQVGRALALGGGLTAHSIASSKGSSAGGR